MSMDDIRDTKNKKPKDEQDGWIEVMGNTEQEDYTWTCFVREYYADSQMHVYEVGVSEPWVRHNPPYRLDSNGQIFGNGIKGEEVDERNRDLDDDNNLLMEPVGTDRVLVIDIFDDALMRQVDTETLTIADTNDMTRDHAYDLDDGIGQDAWMLFKSAVAGDYFLQIEGYGGWFGSYTVKVYEAKVPGGHVPCKPSLTIEAVDSTVYEGADAVFDIHGAEMEMTGAVVELEYSYEGEDYFETSPDPDVVETHLVQLTGSRTVVDLDPDHQRRSDRERRWFGDDQDH